MVKRKYIANLPEDLQQMDLFEETLQKKIYRLERWIHRLYKEMTFLKEVYHLSQTRNHIREIPKKEAQHDMFGT